MPTRLSIYPNDFGLIHFLQKIPPFDQFKEDEIALFNKILSRKQYQAAEDVFTENSQEKTIFIVEEGALTLRILWQKKKDFQKGDMFGEIAVIDNDARTGTVTASKPSILLCASGNDLFDHSKLDTKIAFTIFQALARKVTSYLRTSLQTTTPALIQQGESKNVEFKPRIRCIEDKDTDTRAKFEIVKTIAAFLNSKGGTLFIGVEDNKVIRGLKEFPQNNHDQDMVQCLVQIVGSRIGSVYTDFISAKVEEADGKKILRVDCKPAPLPVCVKDGEADRFFIRDGPTTKELPVKDAYKYIPIHFGGS